MDNKEIAKELMKIANSIVGVGGRNFKDDVKTMDFEQLSELISKRIGAKIKLKVKVVGDKIRLESQDLVSETGVLSGLYKELKVINFDCFYNFDNSGIWLPMIFKATYKGGGRAGLELKDYFWNFKKSKWEV